jgi:hypothetical protein
MRLNGRLGNEIEWKTWGWDWMEDWGMRLNGRLGNEIEWKTKEWNWMED